MHQKAQEYYHIPESSETYLATFYGKKIETGSKDLGTYALARKAIQLNLYYSRYLWKLEWHQTKKDCDDGKLHKILVRLSILSMR